MSNPPSCILLMFLPLPIFNNRSFLSFDNLPALLLRLIGQRTDERLIAALFSQPIFVLGGLLADWVLMKTGSRRASRCGVAIATSSIGVVVFTLAYFVPAGEVTLSIAIITLAATIVSGSNPCGYSAVMDLGGKNVAAMFGAMNMFGNFGAALFPVIVPLWVGWFSWQAVVLFVGALYSVGVICWIFLNPNQADDSAILESVRIEE